MFFYRAWVLNDGENLQNTPVFDVYQSQFNYHKWGYVVLLSLTLIACIILNAFFLSSYVINGISKARRAPNIALICLSIRDLIVCLILIPICIDWYVINLGYFTGGLILCKFTAFLEYYVQAHYPMTIIAFAVILLTRKFPKVEDPIDDFVPLGEMDRSRPPSIMNASRASRAGSVASHRPGSVASRSKPPSVIGSVDGYRNRSGNGYRPDHSRRAGSVTGSIEGRLASGRSPYRPAIAGTRVAQLQAQHGGGQRGGGGFMASSPLPEVDEAASIGDVTDLWESASLDYPGRNVNEGGESPTGWEFMNEEMMYEEPHYHSWHLWLLGSIWLLALAIGIPAAFMVEHRPGNSIATQKRPGCYIPTDPFKDSYSYTINDPGFNFNLASIIVVYLISVVALIILLVLVFCRKTRNSKYRRFVKILLCKVIIFVTTRSPMDILQLSGLFQAAMGFKQLNTLPYEMEYEILLVWTTYVPIVLHPIIYICFLSEVRQGGLNAVRGVCGCEKPDKNEHYKEQEILETRSQVSKTQVSNML